MTKLSLVGHERVSLKYELERLINLFEKTGSIYVEIPTLLQSDLLLDLYGEELNSRCDVERTKTEIKWNPKNSLSEYIKREIGE